MKEYQKINSLYKRDERGRFLLGEWSTPEIEYLKDTTWVWTEKVDGTNIRVMWDGEKILLGGRTDNAQIPAPLVARLQELFPPGSFEGKPPMCLYGEGYGRKIQKVGANYKSDGVDFVLFDVLVGTWWLRDLEGQFGVPCVPVVGRGTILEAVEYVRNGFTSRWGDFQAEGLVLKPEVELRDRGGHRIITKVKTRDF